MRAKKETIGRITAGQLYKANLKKLQRRVWENNDYTPKRPDNEGTDWCVECGNYPNQRTRESEAFAYIGLCPKCKKKIRLYYVVPKQYNSPKKPRKRTIPQIKKRARDYATSLLKTQFINFSIGLEFQNEREKKIFMEEIDRIIKRIGK